LSKGDINTAQRIATGLRSDSEIGFLLCISALRWAITVSYNCVSVNCTAHERCVRRLHVIAARCRLATRTTRAVQGIGNCRRDSDGTHALEKDFCSFRPQPQHHVPHRNKMRITSTEVASTNLPCTCSNTHCARRLLTFQLRSIPH